MSSPKTLHSVVATWNAVSGSGNSKHFQALGFASLRFQGCQELRSFLLCVPGVCGRISREQERLQSGISSVHAFLAILREWRFWLGKVCTPNI